MDGIHDLGGKQGFGPVSLIGTTKPFKADWEITAAALMGRMVRKHHFNMDEYRHAVERMDARDYLSASYFERTFSAVATLCIEKGLISLDEFDSITNGRLPLGRPAMHGRTHEGELPVVALGDSVRVKEDSVGGHIRLPSYIRGKCGIVVSVSQPYPFPDATAHGLSSPKQRCFDVRFQAKDLWTNESDDADIHVGVFHSYLEKIG